MIAQRTPVRVVTGFVALAAVFPGWWHLRVAWITGNPVYAHDLGGLPSNPVFAAWMGHYRSIYADPLRDLAGWRELARLLALTALPALMGLVAGSWAGRRRVGWGLGLVVAAGFGVGWVASISSTAGGLFYSMRVLSPVLVLGCAAGGAGLAHLVPDRRHLLGLVLGLGLFALDASLRALTIPVSPYTVSAGDWLRVGDQLRHDFERDQRPFLEAVAATVTGRTLCDTAGLRRFFAAHERSYSPFWSPDVTWLFTEPRDPEAARRLRGLGFTHVLVKRSTITFDFLRDQGAAAALEGNLEPVMANDLFVLFAIHEPGGEADGRRGGN